MCWAGGRGQHVSMGVGEVGVNSDEFLLGLTFLTKFLKLVRSFLSILLQC